MSTKKWSQVRRQLIPADQEEAARDSARALRDALGLAALRSRVGVTQVELAERLGKSQGNISELEHRGDVYLSSLREYIDALGGYLELAAVFPDDPARAKGNEPGITEARVPFRQEIAKLSRPAGR